MATLAPFRGVRYTQQAGPLERLTAPPYDVISPAEQQRLLQRSPYNVVRLILHPEEPGDDEQNNRYTRAAARLDEWLQAGVLAADERPAIYLYDQEFEIQGRRFTRRGILSLVKLEPLGQGSIYPHEDTLAGPKADRLKLMAACQGDLSPVFGLFPDEDQRVTTALEDLRAAARGDAAVSVDAPDGRHALTPVDDPAAIARLQALMADKPLFIADGHHRYETAWAYRQRWIEEHGEPGPADYVMMVSVAMSDPGLVILPTHRVLRAAQGFDAAAFAAACEPFFEVERVAGPLGEPAAPHEFGAYFGRAQGGLKLRLKDEGAAAADAPERSEAWRMLDVSLLRRLIFRRVLNQDATALEQGPNIAYVHEAAAAQRLVDEEGWEAAFLLHPTRIEQLRAVALAGERMPPKSTYFYPKLLSGLAFFLFQAWP